MSLLLLLVAGLAACGEGQDEIDPGPAIDRDWSAIQERDTLVLLTTYNSTSYFLYRGEPLGYEYELLQAFAEDHDVALRVKVVSTRDSLYTLLNEGVGDVVAARVVPREADSAQIAFTRPLHRTRPALVQRSGDPLDLPDTVDSVLSDGRARTDSALATSIPDSVRIKARLVQNPADLAGREVHVLNRSIYEDRLLELSDSLTGDIEVVEVEGDVSVETLVRRTAGGMINYTIASEDVAELNEEYYTNITVRPTLDDPYKVVWAVRENATELQDALNSWIAEEKTGGLFETLYQRYYVDREGYRERIGSEYLTSETGRLSEYDDILRNAAASIGWDWRLLAAQTFQESRFKPRARSWAGASGLLQLMPATAREFGVSDVFNPEENVAGAARFIVWLQDYWRDKVTDEEQQLRFVLASYNTGHGHVEDARRLTAKNGGDDTVWEDVAYWLLQKSKREVYTDPVVKYGYARGLEPVTYVSLILDRFDHYQEFVDAGEDASVADADEAAGTSTLADASRGR